MSQCEECHAANTSPGVGLLWHFPVFAASHQYRIWDAILADFYLEMLSLATKKR
jgi:hypothetical protein